MSSPTRVIFANKSDVPAELFCHLCSEPWSAAAAKACPGCEEIFCLPCIEDHVLKSTGCPSCSSTVDVAVMRAPPRQLRSMSERNILVSCPFKRGCWTGPWGELGAHVKVCSADPARITYVGDVDTDLQCEICMEPARDPVLAPCCEQLFCHVCITKVLQKDTAECPHCRSGDICEDILMEAPKKLASMLDKLPVVCPVRCSWQGPRVELSAHVAVCNGANPSLEEVRDTAPAAAPAAAAPVTPTGVPTVQMSSKTFHPWIQESKSIEKFTAMAHVVAPSPTPAMSAKRKNLHIAAVMDVSGSMRGEKLRLAKESLQFVVEELQPADKFGLIAFDDRVEEKCPVTDMSAAGKHSATMRIKALKDRGSTNLSGGLFAGIAQARDTPFNPSTAVRSANARVRHADPHSTVRRPSFMDRMLSSIGVGAAGEASTAAPRSGAPQAAAAMTAPAPATKQPRVDSPTDAFQLLVRFNTSPVKCDGKWAARYSFEVADGCTLPAGVSHICVTHPKGGRLTLRVRSTFGLLEEQKADFGVEVYRSHDTNPFAVFQMAVDAEEGVGVCTFAVPGYTPVGTVSVPAESVSVPAESARIVMLFTDGVANAGITDPGALTARTREILEGIPNKDVTIFTFGFGSNHNASLLQQLAEISQGSYYYVERPSQLKEIFADCIGGLLSMVASNIKLTLRPTLGVRIARVMTQFPQAAGAKGDVVVSIKDMYAEEARDVLVELEVAPRSVGAAAQVVIFELAADNIVLGSRQTAAATVTVPTKAEAYTGKPDDDVDQQLSRFLAAEAMSEAQALADAGQVEAAHLRLRATRKRVTMSATAGTGYGQQISRDLEVAEEATRSAAMWAQRGQKQVSKMRASHAMQRANYGDDDTMVFDAYSTSAKVEARARAKR